VITGTDTVAVSVVTVVVDDGLVTVEVVDVVVVDPPP
jgi:hypothetical protein